MTTRTDNYTASVSLRRTGSQDTDVTTADRAHVDAEIQALVEWLPAADRAFLRARFGWDGRAPRCGKPLREELGLTIARQKDVMRRCLRRLGIAHLITGVPATRALLGEAPYAWAARAWAHAGYLLDHETRVRYAHLLLVINGAAINDAQAMLTEHLSELRAIERAEQHRQHVQRTARATARRRVGKLLDHTIWPANPREARDLSEYRTMRALTGNSSGESGYFLSRKLHRFVQHDSGLEREILKDFDIDGRIVAYQEQPIQLPVTIDGRQIAYTPDAIVRLFDGRLIAMEFKPAYRLGDMEVWLRCHALWSWCCEHQAGMFIGSPRTSVLEFYRQAENSPLRSELTDAVDAGPVDKRRYIEFKSQHGASMLDVVHATTTLLLDWRSDPFRITRPSPQDLQTAREFWNVVALAAIRLETQPV